MSNSIILGFVWLIAGNVAGMFPSKRAHWPTAWVLIATGLPLLAWIYVQNGILMTLIFLGAGMSVLRWPVYYLWLWIKRLVTRA